MSNDGSMRKPFVKNFDVKSCAGTSASSTTQQVQAHGAKHLLGSVLRQAEARGRNVQLQGASGDGGRTREGGGSSGFKIRCTQRREHEEMSPDGRNSLQT